MSQATDADGRELITRLDALADAGHARRLQGFFKTGPGEYGEGDVFIGLRMPQIRAVCREFRELPLEEIEFVLAGPVHEHRMAALVVLAEQSKRAFKRGDLGAARERYEFYLAHTRRINNWDLVDVTCRDVVGEYLLHTDDLAPLRRLAQSNLLWERRIAMVSTAAFIRADRCDVAFELAEMLVGDDHDLMHKAVGWMLREAGKRDAAGLDRFLTHHAATMPRTALRYAIERLSESRRKHWMAFKG
ncbi:MAG: DNA alkylation repair protein [Actinobacteria bacterium]|nr:DNA alkylation repair protein [Actinomycetota bacterium]